MAVRYALSRAMSLAMAAALCTEEDDSVKGGGVTSVRTQVDRRGLCTACHAVWN